MFQDVYIKWSICKLFNGGNVILPVQFVAELLKIVRDSNTV